jgi:Uma2 family endonuclease
MCSKVMTEAEYLAFEQTSEIKHEFLNGYAYPLHGARTETTIGTCNAHSLICAYTIIGLGIQLRGGPCAVRASDMRVKVEATGLYTYPDISVVCGEARFLPDVFDTLLNPVLIIEVLSPSTERYDRGKKFHHYQRLESLREYVLIAQDSPHIERFLRQDDGTWILTNVTGMDASLQLASVDAALALADVYEKVTFEAEDSGHDNGSG